MAQFKQQQQQHSTLYPIPGDYSYCPPVENRSDFRSFSANNSNDDDADDTRSMICEMKKEHSDHAINDKIQALLEQSTPDGPPSAEQFCKIILETIETINKVQSSSSSSYNNPHQSFVIKLCEFMDSTLKQHSYQTTDLNQVRYAFQEFQDHQEEEEAKERQFRIFHSICKIKFIHHEKYFNVFFNEICKMNKTTFNFCINGYNLNKLLYTIIQTIKIMDDIKKSAKSTIGGPIDDHNNNNNNNISLKSWMNQDLSFVSAFIDGIPFLCEAFEQFEAFDKKGNDSSCTVIIYVMFYLFYGILLTPQSPPDFIVQLLTKARDYYHKQQMVKTTHGNSDQNDDVWKHFLSMNDVKNQIKSHLSDKNNMKFDYSKRRGIYISKFLYQHNYITSHNRRYIS